MTDSVSFKGYLKRDGQEVEVRRFGVDGGAASSYLYLRSKIQAMFPSIQNDQFQVFWQDNDKDYIRVDSDEELMEALSTANQQPLKIYIQVQNNNPQGGAAGSSAGVSGPQTHSTVTCDGCEGPVVGFRYKCVTCPDYDLCNRCEYNGLHAEHFMLRMPTPMDNYLHHPKFIRKLFSHPHKFHKRHGWSRPTPPSRGCGDSQNGAGRCPFSRRGEGPAAAFAGVTDMFDFSALMDFIESLGVVGGEERANQSTSAGATATPNDASQSSNQGPSTSQSQSQSQDQPRSQSERRQSTPATEYLNNIGQMVAAILDPLGVDVTFDVRTKTSEAQGQQATNASSPTATSPPATAQATAAASAPTQTNPASAPTQTNPATAPTPAPVSTPAPAPTPAPVPSTSSQTETTPAITSETQTEPARERRNSDDWTLLNRESPIRTEMTEMEVDDSQGAKPKTPPPAATQDTLSPSAPPHTNDAESQRVEEAIKTIRSMGFDVNTTFLRELLKKQNGDIFSVLEMMLSAGKK